MATVHGLVINELYTAKKAALGRQDFHTSRLLDAVIENVNAMSHKDNNLPTTERVARLEEMIPAQVQKIAEGDKLPAEKVTELVVTVKDAITKVRTENNL